MSMAILGGWGGLALAGVDTEGRGPRKSGLQRALGSLPWGSRS